MNKQYKNPFEDPEEKLWDKKIKDYKIPKREETPLEGRAERIPGYIYVPSIKLYVAKEKSLHGLNWYNTHKELHKQDLQMLTIRQFIDFMLYLEKNASIPGATKIMDEILTTSTRDLYRGEWLDAKFSEKEGLMRPKLSGTTFIKEEVDSDMGYGYPGTGSRAAPTDPFGKKAEEELYIEYNHKTENGILVAKSIEPLEECLMEECDIDLRSCNKQGLPTKKYSGEGIIYCPPKKDCVAKFGAVQYKAHLSCYIDPQSLGTHNGVRAARIK